MFLTIPFAMSWQCVGFPFDHRSPVTVPHEANGPSSGVTWEAEDWDPR